jgi:PEP-CTERM motif
MKKFVICLSVLVLMLGFGGIASANTTYFDFQNPGSDYGDTALTNYLKTTFGSTNVSTSGTQWTDSTLFGSDVLYADASSGSGTVDFDTLATGASTFKVTSTSFTWLVRNNDWGTDRDFGLDVFDDATGTWHNNVFTITNASDSSSGNSGLLTFNSSWEVTQLRIHDNGSLDVAIDNLTINDNRTAVAPVPEPATMLLLGFGLVGISGLRRKFSS